MARRCASNDPEAPPCYSELKYVFSDPISDHYRSCLTPSAIQNYLNRTDIKTSLGVDIDHVPNYVPVALGVSAAFHASGDAYKDSVDYVAALLERDTRVLVYTGEHDLLCNWPSSDAWTRKLVWTGQARFNREPLQEWEVDGKVAGLTRATDLFTYATLRGAGHMVRGLCIQD